MAALVLACLVYPFSVTGRRVQTSFERLPKKENIDRISDSSSAVLLSQRSHNHARNSSSVLSTAGQLRHFLLSTPIVAKPHRSLRDTGGSARRSSPVVDGTPLVDSSITLQSAPQTHSVSLVALGCPKNTVDAEVMLGDLQRSGLRITQNPEDADIVIVNTCAFVEDAKSESISAVLDAAHLKEDERVPVRGLFVTGCLAQRYAEELAGLLPEVDSVIGFEHYADLPKKVHELLGTDKQERQQTNVLVGSPHVPFRSEEERVTLTPKHLAYIRVAEGCDHACTFCAIPGFRGKFRSKPFDVVIAEAERLVSNGCRELNLIAEDTNQYGSDWGENDSRRLADLLHALAKIPDLKWIRLLYCYPSYFSEELIDAIASIDKVCKYIDIPLQHLSPAVLRRMKRPPSKPTIELLKKLRRRIPNLVIRTTFITGFPGETDEEHDELVQLVSDLRFEHGGAFTYSPEEGTPAHDFEDQIDQEIKEYRRDSLLALFQSNARAWAQEQVGREVSVIIDSMVDGDAVGRTMEHAYELDGMVTLPGAMLLPGMVVKAKVIDVDADEMDLIAVPV
jgi:ribosomal protein S12 methylthiotransferase